METLKNLRKQEKPSSNYETCKNMGELEHVGIILQKVSEAIAVVEAAGDVLLASQLVSAAKARRLAALARRGCTITAVVDRRLAGTGQMQP